MKDYSDKSLAYSCFNDSLMKYQFNQLEVSPLSDERILIPCCNDLIKEIENFISIEG